MSVMLGVKANGSAAVLEAFVLNKGRIIKDKGPKLGYLKSMSRLT